MHSWGDKDVYGRDICHDVEVAADYIGPWLRKWARLSVMQTKEKFGTVRVYCYFGWSDLGSITHPGWYYRPRWANSCSWLRYLNWIVIPIQAKMYRHRYAKAIEKWPHLKEEILCCADQPEFLKGLEK